MQKRLSTLISSIGQAYRNFPSKIQRAWQRQVQPEAWLAGSRAVKSSHSLKHVGPVREEV